MFEPPSALTSLAAGLAARAALERADRSAILGLPYGLKVIGAGGHILREGERPTRCRVLLEGFACRHRIVAGGARQIVAIYVPGDLLDLQNMFVGPADDNVQALTEVTVAAIPIEAFEQLVERRPAIARAMMAAALAEAAIFREWLANIGRRDARGRLAHLLCEIAIRQSGATPGPARRYQLPMTQEQLADMLGLTPVHVNRTFRALEAEGLIERYKRSITIPDWNALASAGDFKPDYLHAPPPARTEEIRLRA